MRDPDARCCDGCSKKHKKPKTPIHTGWWHLSGYTTRKGNVYTGFFCPRCSHKIYLENKIPKFFAKFGN